MPPEPPHVPAGGRPLIQGLPSWRWAVWGWRWGSERSGHCWARAAANLRVWGEFLCSVSGAHWVEQRRMAGTLLQTRAGPPPLPNSAHSLGLTVTPPRASGPQELWDAQLPCCQAAPAQWLPSSVSLLKPVPLCPGPLRLFA